MDDWCNSCSAQGVELYDCGICGRKYCSECYDIHMDTAHADYDPEWARDDYDSETADAMRVDYDETDPW